MWQTLITTKPRRLRTILLSGLVFAAIFLFHHRFFYVHGGYLLDSAWNAFICYRNGILPVWPPTVELMEFPKDTYSAVFYQYHASPIISLFSLASYLQPLNLLNWFSLIQAALLALATYSVCSLADWFLGDSNRWTGVATGGLLGLVFTFNGFIISCLAYPHLEMPLLAFGLCFLVSLVRGRHVPAAACFVLACGAREDAGFHLCALLFMLWIAAHVAPHLRPFKRRFLLFAALGFATSVALLALQKILFPVAHNIPSPLRNAFWGQEGLQITAAMIHDRLTALSLKGLVLVLPVAITVIVAAITRKWVLLLGWLAYVPWFLLNFLSAVPSRQTFEIYHGFPFVFAVVWPLFVLRPPAPEKRPHVRAGAWAAIVLLGASSALGLQHSSPTMFRFFWADLAAFSYQSQKPFEALGRSLRDNASLYGRVAMDDAFGCLFLDRLEPQHVFHTGRHYDTLLFFRNPVSPGTMVRLIMENNLTHTYSLEGTNALIVSNRDIPLMMDGRPALIPSDFWLDMASISPRFARRETDGTISQTKTGMGVLSYGPYIALPAGKYRVTFKVDYVQSASLSPSRQASLREPAALLDVCKNGGQTLMATTRLQGGDLPAIAGLEFEVSSTDSDARLEFRLTTLCHDRLRLTGLKLESR